MRPANSPDDGILTIYRETIDTLYGYVSRQCGGDRALAEDITQETWLRAVREWRHKGTPDRPIAWLTTVARNLLISYYRRKRPSALDAVLAEPEAPPADDGSGPVAAVTDALARMPAPQAELIETFHLEDRSTAEIARQTGVSERAVEGRLRRARQRLRRELEALLPFRGGQR